MFRCHCLPGLATIAATVWLGLGSAAVGAPAAPTDAGTPARAPAIPMHTEPGLATALAQAGRLLAMGEFGLALTILRPVSVPPVCRVVTTVDTPQPAQRAACRDAAAAALAGWNRGLRGAVRFVPAPANGPADLQLILSAAPVGPDAPDGVRLQRTVQAGMPTRVFVHAPATGGRAALVRKSADAVGLYLGLTPTGTAAPVAHAPTPVGLAPAASPGSRFAAAERVPTDSEVSRAIQLLRARTDCAGFARRRVKVQCPLPVLTLASAVSDLGEVRKGVTARFTFTVRNTGSAPLEIEAKPNCGCTITNERQRIEPGQSGTLHADILTTAFRGELHKTLTLASNDPLHPQTTLEMRAVVLPLVQVMPAEDVRLALADDAPTTRRLEVRVRDASAVSITGVACGVPYATAVLTPRGDAAPGEARYDLDLTVGPQAAQGRTSFLVALNTSSPIDPQVNVLVVCEKGILTTPPCSYLGALGPATPLPVRQVVTLSRGSGAFRIKSASTGDPRLQVRVSPIRDGAEYRLDLTYLGGWPAGSVNARVTVETDDPLQPTIIVPVTGTVSEKLQFMRGVSTVLLARLLARLSRPSRSATLAGVALRPDDAV